MRHLNRYTVIISLIFTALTVEAVQLGSARGSAVFGRPLDLSVQVRLDTPAEEAANCFSAEVFQADNKFDVGRVRLDVAPAANGLDATVRVRSATAVNEPWAKVILRSNCGAKVSRQYDFLTDFANDMPTGNMLAESAPALPSANPGNTTATAKSNTTIAQAPVSNWNVKRSQAKATASQQKSATQVAQMPLTPKKVKPITPANTVAASDTKKTTDMVAVAVGQSRLKMETFELTDEHQVLLKLSTALVAPTGMRTPEDIQALAQATAVWRAVNGMPADVKAIETPAADVVAAAAAKALVVEKPPMTMPSLMNQKLAGKSECSNLMVYGLIGLLTLTLGCIAWLWLRVRKASRAGYGWLNDSVTDDVAVDHEPTQFLHSKFYETETVPKVAQETQFEVETEQEPQLEQIVEIAPVLTSEPEQEIFIEVTEVDNKVVPVDVPTTVESVFSPLPAHFDDPRFDDRILHVKKKDRNLTHEKPIASTAELMKLVLADIPPKLRSVGASSPESIEKTNVTTSNKVVKAKDIRDDAKGNLIDFDVFADPEPLNKPTRFVR